MRRGATLRHAVEGALTAGLVSSGIALVLGLTMGSSATLRVGSMLLILTPVARVVVVTAGMFLEGDFLFGIVSTFVLTVLGMSAWLGFR